MPIAGRNTGPATRTQPKPAAASAAKAAPAEVHAQEAKLTVTKTITENGTIQGEPVVEETIEIHKFQTDTARSSLSAGFKVSLSQYENAQVNVTFSLPHYVEEADSAYAQIVDKVAANLQAAHEALNLSQYANAAGGGFDEGTGEGGTEAEGAAEGAPEGGDDLTAEWAAGASREDIVKVIAENPELGIDPDDYPEDSDLREVFIATAFEEGPADGSAEGGQATAEVTPYTEAELLTAKMADLQEVWTEWEMGEFPKFNAKSEAVVKKSVIKKMLAKQDERFAAA